MLTDLKDVISDAKTCRAYLFGACIPALLGAWQTFDNDGLHLLGRAGFFIIGFLFSAPIVFMFGVPSFWLLRKSGLLNIVTLCLAGAACGALMPLLFRGHFTDTAETLSCSLSGLLAAIVFCITTDRTKFRI